MSLWRRWSGWVLFALLTPLVLAAWLLVWAAMLVGAVVLGVGSWWLEGLDELRGHLARRRGRPPGPEGPVQQ